MDSNYFRAQVNFLTLSVNALQSFFEKKAVCTFYFYNVLLDAYSCFFLTTSVCYICVSAV